MAAGDTIDYKVVATNTGNMTLTNVAVARSGHRLAHLHHRAAPATLAPGASMTCTGQPHRHTGRHQRRRPTRTSLTRRGTTARRVSSRTCPKRSSSRSAPPAPRTEIAGRQAEVVDQRPSSVTGDRAPRLPDRRSPLASPPAPRGAGSPASHTGNRASPQASPDDARIRSPPAAARVPLAARDPGRRLVQLRLSMPKRRCWPTIPRSPTTSTSSPTSATARGSRCRGCSACSTGSGCGRRSSSPAGSPRRGRTSPAACATPATRSATTATATNRSAASTRRPRSATCVRGLAALDEVLGVRPVGYRRAVVGHELPDAGPAREPGSATTRRSWTRTTRIASPATAAARDGRALVELPVHWSLDDWNRYNYVPGYAARADRSPVGRRRRLGGGARGDRRGRRPVHPDDAPVRRPAGPRAPPPSSA